MYFLEARTVGPLSSRRASSDRGEMRCMQTVFTEGGQWKEQLSLSLGCGGTLSSGTLCLPTFAFMEVWFSFVLFL